MQKTICSRCGTKIPKGMKHIQATTMDKDGTWKQHPLYSCIVVVDKTPEMVESRDLVDRSLLQ